MRKEPSELVKLFNDRARMYKFDNPWVGPYIPPRMGVEAERKLHEAARAHAAANPSDPFAEARVSLYMRRGFEFVSDVAKDAQRALKARRDAKIGEAV